MILFGGRHAYGHKEPGDLFRIRFSPSVCSASSARHRKSVMVAESRTLVLFILEAAGSYINA